MLLRYNKNGEKIEYPASIGLVSQAIRINSTLKVKNCENHPDYNGKFLQNLIFIILGLVDIHTNMPVTIVPILCSLSQMIVGVLEIVNPNSASKYQIKYFRISFHLSRISKL